ncbi:unnamed protein product [Pedinophyceae sp. YPF-701]|nr:unnamed protein product [Pedinophyceae sp. YPF-701]
MNALHPDVLADLASHLQRAQSDSSVSAIVITGEGQNFSAGFDVAVFASKARSGPGDGEVVDARGINAAFCRLVESGPKPVVAAIDGICLGGGLELAMACAGRVAAPSARLGLPELKLGIIPGFGGTQRLPRLVGVKTAMDMMLTSKQVPATKALELGLLDEVCPPGNVLVSKACQMAGDIASGSRARSETLSRTDRLEDAAVVQEVLKVAEKRARKAQPNVEFPGLCIAAVRAGLEKGGLAGLEVERQCFSQAQAAPAHKALVHVFFASRATKRVCGVTDAGVAPRELKTIAVVGGGLMGSGIATASALAGYTVLLKEINQKMLEAGMGRIHANLASRVKKGAMTEAKAKEVAGRVRGCLDYSAFRSADLVIEAALERVDLKQAIFADLEKACRPDCILSTNTSTINISKVGAKTKASARILGVHFFSPAHVMPLLEIVKTDETSKQVLVDTLAYATKIKKTPVIVGNCTGFAVNRMFFPYTMAACLLVDLGVDPYTLDFAIMGFGMPMGPFRLADLVGVDISVHVGANFVDDFPERVYQSKLIQLMHDLGRLGEKTKGGFYNYKLSRQGFPEATISPVVETSRREAGLIARRDGKRLQPTKEQLVSMVFFPVVNEACRIIDEGIVDKPSDLDVSAVMAMGFPAYRGGVIHWADSIGAAAIAAALQQWAEAYPETAGFWKPCDFLLRCARSGAKLGGGAATSRL